MAANESNQITTTYQPGGNTYTYLRNFQGVSVKYEPSEEKVLESWDHDTSYPGQYCNTVVYGGVEIEVSSILKYKPGWNPITTTEYMESSVNLAKPLSKIYGTATHFRTNMVFGQSVGETEPSKIVFEYPISGGTDIKWYKNGALVATDHSVNLIPECAIACVYSGTTVTKYAYVYIKDGAYWTTGGKTTAEVLQIINTAGTISAQDNTSYGWEDENGDEFIISKIFDENGNDNYTGNVAGGRTGETISSANADLLDKCTQYGGYIGTDILESMTGLNNAEAWTYLTTNPAADGLTWTIPTNTGTYELIWRQQYNWFDINLNGTKIADIPLQYRQAGHHIYITWYKQSSDIANATQYMLVTMASIGGDPGYIFRSLNSLAAQGLDYEEYDNEQALFDEIDGYDPESGQEDDEQDDPADIDDPANDPLSTGFLYAFMVDASDMANLADCLVPETLSQKIRADFGNNLFEFIVSYHMMPCLSNASSDNKIAIAYRGNPFVYGENNTQLQLARITQTWYNVSCGSKVCLPTGVRKNGFENWANANVQLYLPFIGIVHLNTADVWGKAVTINYRFDILQGTCVANVGVQGQGTIYSFEGSCKYAIPFTSIIDKSNQELLSGIVSGAGAAVSIAGIAAGGVSAGSLMNAATSVGDAAGHFISAAEHKSVISRGGNLTGSPGWNMPRKPALIITVPECIRPSSSYNANNGYPCHVSGAVGEWTNSYIECGQVDLIAQANQHGAMPNDSELSMIKSLLKDGVYV